MAQNRDNLVIRSVSFELQERPRIMYRHLHLLLLTLALVVCRPVSAQPTVSQFLNEVVIQNSTPWTVTITVTPKHVSMEGQGSTFILQPGGSTLIGRYSEASDFVSPVQRMTVTGTVRNRNGKQKTIGVLMMDKRQVDPQHRIWNYHVMGSGGSVGFSF